MFLRFALPKVSILLFSDEFNISKWFSHITATESLPVDLSRVDGSMDVLLLFRVGLFFQKILVKCVQHHVVSDWHIATTPMFLPRPACVKFSLLTTHFNGCRARGWTSRKCHFSRYRCACDRTEIRTQPVSFCGKHVCDKPTCTCLGLTSSVFNIEQLCAQHHNINLQETWWPSNP